MNPNELRNATGCGAAIADDAAEYGYVPRLLRDNGLSGNRFAALWDCAGAQALEVGSVTRWSTDHPSTEWVALVARELGD